MADINITNDWLAALNPPEPSGWPLIASNVSSIGSIGRNDYSIITFTNLTGGYKVAEPPNSLPYDSVLMETTYDIYNGPRLLRKAVFGEYIIWSGNLLMAAYTDSGYWAYGTIDDTSPGVILTGAGSAENTPCEIEWTAIASEDNEKSPPAPFPSESILNGFSDYDLVSCVPNEILSNYKVINDNTIAVRPSDIDRPFAGTGRLFVSFTIDPPDP